MERSEKIQIVRGILQLVGIALIIMALVYAVKLKERKGCDLNECVYVPCDGCASESTGLYGNCQWIKEHLEYTTDAPVIDNDKSMWMDNMSIKTFEGLL
jgi:hypothetical protein